MSSRAKRAGLTAGERIAMNFVGPHPTLARRIEAAIRRAVKARDAKWLAAAKAHATMNWLTVFGAVLDAPTPAAHQTGKVKARTNIRKAVR